VKLYFLVDHLGRCCSRAPLDHEKEHLGPGQAATDPDLAAVDAQNVMHSTAAPAGRC
jgi:hypothetical protein